MAFARTVLPGTDNDGPYTVGFPYIVKAHVRVYVDGTEDTTFTWENDTQIRTTSSVPSSSTIVIIRETSQGTRLVDYVGGTNFTEASLDKDSKQAYYMAQEALDKLMTLTPAQVWDALNKRITNVADPTSAQDAATKNYVDTTASAGGPSATETLKGLVELATQAETDAGTANGSSGPLVVTPPKLVTLLGQVPVNLLMLDAAGPALLNEAASATNPTLVPNKADLDTGIGWIGADLLSVVVGGVTVAEFEAVSETLQLNYTSDTSGHGPSLVLDRKSDAAAANHYIGRIFFRGSTAGGASDGVNYARFGAQIVDPTDGAQTGRFFVDLWSGGGLVTAMQVESGILFMNATSGPALMNEDASSTNPTLVPNRGDVDSGVGWSGNHPWLVSSGTAVAEFADNGVAVNYFRFTNAPTTLPPSLDVEGSDTDIGLNITTKGTGDLTLQIGAATKFILSADTLRANLAAGPAILNETASATNPTLCPNQADLDTGIGWPGANTLAAIVGGAQAYGFGEQKTQVATTSGTSVTISSIPSWVTAIIVQLDGVSTDNTSELWLQIGDSGGIETSGYTQSCTNVRTTSTSFGSSAFSLNNGSVAADSYTGAVTLSLMDAATNKWCLSGTIRDTATLKNHFVCSGVKSLSDTLTQLRITTLAGTNNFDAGSLNVLFVGGK